MLGSPQELEEIVIAKESQPFAIDAVRLEGTQIAPSHVAFGTLVGERIVCAVSSGQRPDSERSPTISRQASKL